MQSACSSINLGENINIIIIIIVITGKSRGLHTITADNFFHANVAASVCSLHEYFDKKAELHAINTASVSGGVVQERYPIFY